MSAKTEEIESLRESLMDKAGRLDHLLKEAAKLLADNTNYTSLVTTPSYRGRRVKFLQLTDVDSEHVLLVMVLEGNLVRNKMLISDQPVDKEVVLKLNILLNMDEKDRSLIDEVPEDEPVYRLALTNFDVREDDTRMI